MFYSKWTSEKDLKKYLTEVEIGSEMQKSGIQMLSEGNKIYIKDDESHSLVIGSAGSGKTQAVVLPLVRTIIKANESFLINDIKGEIMNKVGGELKKRGYNIIVLDYANLKIGNHYNVLDFPYYLYNNDEKDKAIEILENIAYYIMHDIDSTSDPFWEKTAGDYFVGLALYLFDNAKSEEINLNSIFNLSNDIFKDEKGYDKLIMNSLDKSSSTYQFLSGTLFSPKETSGGIIATFSQKIKGFVTREKLSSMMSTSDFDFKNIGNEKTAIFVITGTANYANDLVSILVDELFYSLDLFKNKNNRFNLILDEFDSMKPIKDFYSRINYARGNNIKITALIKDLTNLNIVYGTNYKDLIRMCFNNIIYLLANDLYTLEEISKLCGNTEKGPLISIQELKTLDNFEEVILMTRMYPVRTKVLPDYKINWNFDNSELEFNNLGKNQINLFDIEKFLKK